MYRWTEARHLFFFAYFFVAATSFGVATPAKTVVDFGAIGYPPVLGDCGAGAVGAADDTAALTAAANQGLEISLASNTCYKITSTIVSTTSYSGLVGDRTSVIYMPAKYFNNASLENIHSTNALGFYAHGMLAPPFTPVSNVTFRGFTIQSEVQDERRVSAIAGRNVENLVVRDLEIHGFPVGFGIMLDSINGGSVFGNDVHDFASNSIWNERPQTTGVVIDDYRVNKKISQKIEIKGNTIRDLKLGPIPVARWGYQTDGINPQSIGPTYFSIIENQISGVGECIDIFASDNLIAHNRCTDAKLAAYKLIHSASRNRLSANVALKCGLYCMYLGGSTVGDVSTNIIENNKLEILDQDSQFGAFQTACIRFDGNRLPYLPVGNIIRHNICNARGGKFGIFGGEGDGSGNILIGNSIINASKSRYNVPASVGSFQ